MFKKLASFGGIGLAGLALIGTGAMATFTQDTTSIHPVTAGTMNVVLSTGGGPQSQTLELPATGPTGSTFATTAYDVQIDNLGSVKANEVRIQLTDENNRQPADLALHDQMYACLYSNGYILFNQPLTVAEAYGSIAVGTQLIPPPDHYTLVLYAGSAFQGCGGPSTSIANGAFQPNGPTLPGVGTNTAASLNNDAQGGLVKVKVTISYEG